MNRNTFLNPRLYRNLAAAIAVLGSLLLWRHGNSTDIAAFAAVMLMFFGALLAVIAASLALKAKNNGLIIQSLILMFWLVALPLTVMMKLAEAV
ncbi:MAG: hypothetical protein Q4D82_06030 [Neisseria sp.]|nr:hypothetical protein [Neisseria sp.]